MTEPSSPSQSRWLVVFCGPSGTGKTTVSKAVAAATGACYLRVDAVETALARSGQDVGAAGYAVVHELAASNLLLGTPVVVDAVNPVPEARAGWRATADRCGARLVMVETMLPDAREHRRRVDQRQADIPGHRVPTWAEVERDGWLAWDVERDGPRHQVDTTTAQAAVGAVLALLPPDATGGAAGAAPGTAGTPPDLVRLREALEASWEPRTAHLGVDDPDRPSLGQCYPTARVLQLLHPHLEIVEGVVDTGAATEKHFWNLARTDVGDLHLDLTWQQFPPGSRVLTWQVRDRDALGDSPQTLERVQLLLTRVREHLGTSPRA